MTANKRQAIRNMLAQLGMQAKPQEVAETLESHGIEVSERLVSRVKVQMVQDESRATRERSKRPPKPKSRHRPQQRKIPPRRG